MYGVAATAIGTYIAGRILPFDFPGTLKEALFDKKYYQDPFPRIFWGGDIRVTSEEYEAVPLDQKIISAIAYTAMGALEGALKNLFFGTVASLIVTRTFNLKIVGTFVLVGSIFGSVIGLFHEPKLSGSIKYPERERLVDLQFN